MPIPNKAVGPNAWPKKYSCRFIEPGLVHYNEYGTVMVRKEVLDRMAQSFVGKPVINEEHMDVSPDNFEEVADGVVTAVHYEQDGWWWADFIVWDDLTKKNCENGAYSVSCAYDVTDFKSEKGTHNNIPYEQEVLDGQYTHLAIVANPRYEDARIVVYNSKGGNGMIVKLWHKLTGKDEKREIANGADALFVVDGESIPVKELVNSYKLEKANQEKLSEDTLVEIDGEEVPMKNLVESHRANKKRLNESDEAKKKDEEDAKKKAENAAAEEEKKKKDDDERKNAEDEAKKKAEEDDKKKHENALTPEEQKHFNDLKRAAELRGEPQEIKVATMKDKVQEGRERYGEKK